MLELGEGASVSPQHPAQDLQEHLGCSWKHVGPVGEVEKLVSPCWGHLELGVSPWQCCFLLSGTCLR